MKKIKKLIIDLDNNCKSIYDIVWQLHLNNIDEPDAYKMLQPIINSRIERIRKVLYSYLEWLLYNPDADLYDYIFLEDANIIRSVIYGNHYNNSLLKDLVKNKRLINDLEEEVYKFELEKDKIYSLKL